jgi:cellulose synthase/poly-beta-1,6-N-acetylglucosamine synthase-like glycosyltransferase
MLLSILIPCQEDGFLLFPTLKSIFQNEFPIEEFEIVLLHNDNVQISKNVDKFRVRKYSGTFMNQAQALNWGLEKARGEIICITKPGCIVDSNWLAEINEFFHRHSDVDGIGGPVFPCWEYGTEIQKLASQIFHEEQGFPNSIVTPHLNEFRGLFHATNSAFRREVFE